MNRAALALVPEVEDRQTAAVIDEVLDLVARAVVEAVRDGYVPSGTRPKGLLRKAADGREGR